MSMRRYIPFSGGPRKCVGDQFALMEAVVALAALLHRFDVALVPGQSPGMTTGATIHTVHGLYVTLRERGGAAGRARRSGEAEPAEVQAGERIFV